MNGDAEAAPIGRSRRRRRRSDPALIRAAQRGSSEAVEELFRRYWPPAHRAATLIAQDSAAAEDIAQEAFLAAIRALDQWLFLRAGGERLRASDNISRQLDPGASANGFPRVAAWCCG